MNTIVIAVSRLFGQSGLPIADPSSPGRKLLFRLRRGEAGEDIPFIMRFVQDVRRLEGVLEVKVDIAHEEVVVAFDPARLDMPQLPVTLAAQGYRALVG